MNEAHNSEGTQGTPFAPLVRLFKQTEPTSLISGSVLRSRVRFKPDVMIQQVGGESVLLDLKSEEYFGLDPVGTRMMALLNETSNVGVALNQLAEEYDVDRSTLERDLLELISECAAHGLVTIGEPGS